MTQMEKSVPEDFKRGMGSGPPMAKHGGDTGT